MIELINIKKIPIHITGNQVNHPTDGYRRWEGKAESVEAIVAIAIIESESEYSWVRCSALNANYLPLMIQFSPYDENNLNNSVSFGINDSIVHNQSYLKSSLALPNPIVGNFTTGSLINFAEIESEMKLSLNIIFFAKTDVHVGRKSIWHLKVDQKGLLDDDWQRAFTYGRTGTIKKAK
jgi:hypothetical protein